MGLDVLHMAALLAEVAYEKALLLEQCLEMVELVGLLLELVLAEADRGISFLLALLEHSMLCLELAKIVHRQDLRDLGETVLDLMALLCLRDLALERAELARDLALHILGTGQALVHALELALASLLAPPVLRDAGSFLDELTAVFRPACEDRIELSLGDDRMGVLAQTRVVEDVLDIEKTCRGSVDEILGLARPIHAAGDSHLVEVDRQRMVRVVEHDRDFCHAHGLPGRGAGEDDILHSLATEHLGRLLSQNPQDRVGDIRLAAAIRSHHDIQAWVECHAGLVGK